MTGNGDTVRRLIQEQVGYYDRRAAAYDEDALLSEGPLAPQFQQIRDALRRFEPSGVVLELACGTGSRTQWLLEDAAEITALDSSAQMLERARRKIRDRRVTFVEADLFSWTPSDSYDVVCFFFWLSHVPPTLFESFWDLVGRCLVPSGRVFFADEAPRDSRTEEIVDPMHHVVRRTLLDGSSHRAVKIFWEPKDLEARLQTIGWDVAVQRTEAFYWGKGRILE